MLVELDIFSGRPNPQWHMDESECEEFVKLLQALPRREPQEITTKGLGYRGIIVFESDERHGPFDRLTIYRGQVAVLRAGTTTHLADTDRAVEYWLIENSRRHIGNDLFHTVLSMME